MSHTTAYARIIKAGKGTYWYSEQIGKLVEVLVEPSYDSMSYKVYRNGVESRGYVDKADVELIRHYTAPERKDFAKFKY